VCVTAQQVCDGRPLCPQHDDEWFCDLLVCPAHCQCQGWAFTCPKSFNATTLPRLRFLDASGSGMRLLDVRHNPVLVVLKLARCGLQTLDRVSMGSLQELDLSHNLLRAVDIADLRPLAKLRVLSLSGNPLTSIFPSASSPIVEPISSLLALDLSDVYMPTVDLAVLAAFPNLQRLDLSRCQLDTLTNQANASLTALESVDMRGCPLTGFPHDLLLHAQDLHLVATDNFKLCCSAMLPAGFPVDGCRAPFNEVSSCDNLLRSDVYLAFLSVFCFLSLLGNAGSLLYRGCLAKRVAGGGSGSSRSGFAVFVVNLCLSDLLMGVYLFIIGVADRSFHNDYLWQDDAWRHSAACTAAGLLSLTSCEVSAFLIFLITLDRFLVLRFPFSRMRFGWRSAWLACAVCWLAGLCLATVPLLPWTDRWDFYSQTGICIPLPVTINVVGAGRHYAFAIMVILNFALFVLIAAGQASVFLAVRGHRHMPQLADTDVSKVRRAQDKTVARRLLTVAMANFLCCFPVGLLGILSASGLPVSGEVNVVIAIFVLPLNSALNPFLYTFNVYRERVQQRKEARLLAYLRQSTQFAPLPSASTSSTLCTDLE
jgi:hypothetical protein